VSAGADSLAETWLRRGMAAVGAMLLISLVGGSAAGRDSRAGSGGAAAHSTAPGTSGPAVGVPPATATPTGPVAPPPVLAVDGGTAPAPTPAGVARALAGPLADRRFGGPVAARVLDAVTGAVLLDRAGAAPAVPASTAKLATAAAVLAVLRPDDRLVTRVVAGTRPGEVVLVGAGDPTLSAARRGTPTAYEGAARLSTLAAAVRKATTTKITRLLVDGSRFTGTRLGPGWDPADVAGGYVAPITAVMVDGGRTSPAVRARSSEPDLAAGRAFAAALGVSTAAVARGAAEPGARMLGQVASAPVTRLVESMLLTSDNVLAEMLARQVAIAERSPASFPGAADAVRRVLARLGVPTAGERLVDGSGLSRLDRVTPDVLVAVLRAALSAEHPALHALVPGLPVGGYAGSLHDRYLSLPSVRGAGAVRAKTGTLDGVSALAGVVTDREGRLLIFAFLANGVPVGGTLRAESALDTAAAALAGCGCR